MTDRTPQQQDASPPRRRTGLRILLFVSLALNMVILGLVGGAILNVSRGEDHPMMVSRDLGLGAYFSALEAPERRALNQELRARRGELRATRTQWRRSVQDVTEAIRAEPFDPAQVRAAVERQAELAARGREYGRDVMISHLEGMTPEQRASFADRLEEMSRRNQEQRRGKGGGDGMRRPPPPPPN